MKILFAINTMNVGGAETGLVELANVLIENHEIDILLTYQSGPLIKKLDPRIRVKSILEPQKPLKNLIGAFNIGLSLLGAQTASKKYVSDDYDLYIAYLEGYPSLLISNVNSNALKCSSIRVGIKQHKTLLDKLPWGYNLQNNMYSKFDKIHCVSESTKDEFDDVFPKHSDKTFFLTTGFDIDGIIKKSEKEMEVKIDLSEDFTNIISVGRMEEQKGYNKIFEAIDILEKQNIYIPFRIYIVGNNKTKYAENLKELYPHLLNKYIYIVGQVSNPYPYMKAADIVLSSSNYEGFPRVISEALVLKKNVAATNITQNMEALASGKYGYIIPNDTQGFVEFFQSINTFDFSELEIKNVKSLDEFASTLLQNIKEPQSRN